jgi:hypothetical protein
MLGARGKQVCARLARCGSAWRRSRGALDDTRAHHVSDDITSVEHFRNRQMRAGRWAAVASLGVSVVVLLVARKSGHLLGVPLRLLGLQPIILGAAGLLLYLFVDSLRCGLVFTHTGVIRQGSRRLAFALSLALMCAVAGLLVGLSIFFLLVGGSKNGVV